jgi:hypothetical protein
MANDVYANMTPAQIFETWKKRVNDRVSFRILAEEVPCIKNAVMVKYFEIKGAASLNVHGVNILNAMKTAAENMALTTGQISDAANVVWFNDQTDVLNILRNCSVKIKTDSAINANILQPGTGTDVYDPDKGPMPFDRRLDRLEQNLTQDTQVSIVPFYTAFADVATSGYLISQESLNDLPSDTKGLEDIKNMRKIQYNQLLKDSFYYGVPALQNAYALTRLYGSDSGAKLVNQKGQRRWYEVDISPDQEFNYASTPTTSALIDWGSGDPYGRTPYFFTDFVFSKYWNKIANNRLITLRRYPAPILDNLKFPGMSGNVNSGSSQTTDANATDIGSSSAIKAFTPMASAVTYFGGETGNTLNSLLKFTTGVNWGEVQGEIWNATTDSVPDNMSGIGTIFKGVGKLAELLNVTAGNFDPEFIAAGGVLPPDPYNDGPFENRIQGPVNRIDKVMKRDPGLKYENNLSLTFEYVARPVGGINPKAVLLDILSNFLVIGSASAVFFGGAHRFMNDPAKYPFVGNAKKLYEGKPIEYAEDAIKKFSGDQGILQEAATEFLASIKGFWNQLFSGEKGSPWGAGTSIFEGGTGNLIKNAIAKKTAGQVPYLKGMKSILTGEPVGEWHITIGNPLNPIAMIGNLVCDNIQVEFNEELGPDDFPTEMKVTVNLKHAMARDRDAIESIFNRGMGRIYNLPDGFLGSADYQTVVDPTTRPNVATGTMNNATFNIKYTPGQDRRFVNPKELKGTNNKLSGAVSVWERSHFHIGFSENSEITPRLNNEILRTAYRTADWLAKKALL